MAQEGTKLFFLSMYPFVFLLIYVPFYLFSLAHAFLRAVHRSSNERCIAKRWGALAVPKGT